MHTYCFSLRKVSFLVFLMLAVGCSTEKNTFITRAYHNLTAHYNVYFNGEQNYEKTLKQLNENLEEDYTLLLPIFKGSADKVPSMLGSSMDKTIKKTVKLVKLHSITVPPKRRNNFLTSGNGPLQRVITERRKELRSKNEYCKWVDDAYLLMGKAHYYKHDFMGAVNAFKLLLRKHNTTELSDNAWYWLSKNYIELENYDNAKIYLNKLEEAQDLSKKLKAGYNLAYADYYVRREEYNSAVQKLGNAVQYVRDNRKIARYHYILAQLNQKIENYSLAFEHYGTVIDQNPPYEMAFNAKINRALSFEGKGQATSIEQELLEMSRDAKNEEYLDRIYYALAKIAREQNNIKKAEKYYTRAADNIHGRSSQAALIYLDLGDIAFDNKNYEASAAYYDSTMNSLTQDHENYDKIYSKAKNLTELVNNLRTYQRQDSLQKVAQMPSAKRKRLISNIIREKKREKKQQRSASRSNRSSGFPRQNNTLQQNKPGVSSSSGNKWYFYNPSMVNRGISEFKSRWGERELEDNWRRSNRNKSTSLAQNSMEEESQNTKSGDKTSMEYYRKELPLTDSAMRASKNKEMEAVYNAGEVYRDKIGDIEKAKEMFHLLIDNFSNTEYELEGLYQLYQIAEQNNNSSQAAEYKRKITSKYPDSRYAKILSDPQYVENLKNQRKKISNVYSRAFTQYKNQAYQDALKKIQSAVKNYPDDPLISRFLLLKAMVHAERGEQTKYRSTLETIITDYPKSDVKETAQKKLNAYKKHREEIAKKREKLYNNSSGEHLLAIVFNPTEVKLEQFRFDVLSFNIDFYENKDLDINISDFNKKQKSLAVTSFNNLTEAREYYHKLLNNKDEYLKSVNDYNLVLISPENYKTLKEDKNIDRYLEFFNKNYKL